MSSYKSQTTSTPADVTSNGSSGDGLSLRERVEQIDEHDREKTALLHVGSIAYT